MNFRSRHWSLGNLFSSRFSTRSFYQGMLNSQIFVSSQLLKDKRFQVLSHRLSLCHFSVTVVFSLGHSPMGSVSAYQSGMTLQRWFSWCAALILPPFLLEHLPISHPVLHQSWAICLQVLTKYRYPENIFQALTTKTLFWHCSFVQIFWNFFQIIWPT